MLNIDLDDLLDDLYSFNPVRAGEDRNRKTEGIWRSEASNLSYMKRD